MCVRKKNFHVPVLDTNLWFLLYYLQVIADVLEVGYIQEVMQKKLCEIKAPKYEISFYYLEMIIFKILLDLSRIIILWGGCTKEQSKVDFRHGLVH